MKLKDMLLAAILLAALSVGGPVVGLADEAGLAPAEEAEEGAGSAGEVGLAGGGAALGLAGAVVAVTEQGTVGETALGLADEAGLAPAEEPAGDVVYTSAELAAWLEAHFDTGGSVCFGADITAGTVNLKISDDALNQGATMTIDTGSFGLTVTSGLLLGEGVTLTGAGYPQPVVSMAAGADLYSRGAEGVRPMPWIKATGDQGTAIELCEGSYFIVVSSEMGFGVSASGRQGVAIDCSIELTDPEFELRGMVIEATGPGGKGIVSSKPLSLLLCQITADAAAVEAPSVLLDTCDVSPAVPGATVVQRSIRLPASTLALIGIIPLGFEMPDGCYCFIVLEAPGYQPIDAVFTIRIDPSAVDSSAPGHYPMPLYLPAPYNLASHDLSSFITEVVDTAVPYFYKSESIRFPVSAYFLYYYFGGDPRDLLLWRSDDLGETWQVWWTGSEADEDGVVDGCPVIVVLDGPYHLTVRINSPSQTLDHEVLLLFEVLPLQSGSVVLYVDYASNDVKSGIGGDRTGTDRFPFAWLYPDDDSGDGGDTGSGGAGDGGDTGSGGAGGTGGAGGGAGGAGGAGSGGAGGAGGGTGGAGAGGSGGAGGGTGGAGAGGAGSGGGAGAGGSGGAGGVASSSGGLAGLGGSDAGTGLAAPDSGSSGAADSSASVPEAAAPVAGSSLAGPVTPPLVTQSPQSSPVAVIALAVSVAAIGLIGLAVVARRRQLRAR